MKERTTKAVILPLYLLNSNPKKKGREKRRGERKKKEKREKERSKIAGSAYLRSLFCLISSTA